MKNRSLVSKLAVSAATIAVLSASFSANAFYWPSSQSVENIQDFDYSAQSLDLNVTGGMNSFEQSSVNVGSGFEWQAYEDDLDNLQTSTAAAQIIKQENHDLTTTNFSSIGNLSYATNTLNTIFPNENEPNNQIDDYDNEQTSVGYLQKIDQTNENVVYGFIGGADYTSVAFNTVNSFECTVNCSAHRLEDSTNVQSTSLGIQSSTATFNGTLFGNLVQIQGNIGNTAVVDYRHEAPF